jgi:hypothetical protein
LIGAAASRDRVEVKRYSNSASRSSLERFLGNSHSSVDSKETNDNGKRARKRLKCQRGMLIAFIVGAAAAV